VFHAAEHLAEGRCITETTLAQAYAQTVNTGFLEFNPFEGNPPVESLLGQGFAKMLTEAGLPMPKTMPAGGRV
jgi:hypothetical protein